jgi:hypothetical protein
LRGEGEKIMSKQRRYVITLTNEQLMCLQRIVRDILEGKAPHLGSEEDRQAGKKILKALERGVPLS